MMLHSLPAIFMARPGQTDPPGHGRYRRQLRPVLFYVLAFPIDWAAWTPLLPRKLDVLRLPFRFVITLFIGQSVGAFAPLLSLVVVQRISDDPTLIQRVFSQFRFRRTICSC